MKIFISWSGHASKVCAEILRDWIKCTLQASEPWISTKDIDKGSIWFNEINDQLKDTRVGIVCLTKENKEKPWILFEAGALAKGLSTNRVCTLLVNLKPADLENPLGQFNHTTPDKSSMKQLLQTINKELGDDKLEDRILNQVFTAYWETFESKFNDIKIDAPPEDDNEVTRSKDDILDEILYTTRGLDKRIRMLERSPTRIIQRKLKTDMSESMSRNKIAERIHYLKKQGMSVPEIEEVISSGSSYKIISARELDRLLGKDNCDNEDA